MEFVYRVAQRYLPSNSQKRILIGLPLTFETLCVVDALRSHYPNLIVIPQSSGENSSTQEGAFPYLEKWGIKFFRDASERSRLKSLSEQPDVLIDCSFMLGEVALRNNLLDQKTVIIEDTKTGENRLHFLKKEFPFTNSYIILDNSKFKRNYENSIGIGYSVVGALISLGFYLPSYHVGLIGYGPVGYGVAQHLKKLGVSVSVCEIDSGRKAAAKRHFPVMEKEELLKTSDIIVTATGVCESIVKNDIERLGKRIILVNAGGEDEWRRNELFAGARGKYIHEHIVEYTVGDTTVLEVGGGNSINLVRGISISEFLDITFAHLIYILFQVEKKSLPKGNIGIEAFYNSEFANMVEEKYGFGNTYGEQ